MLYCITKDINCLDRIIHPEDGTLVESQRSTLTFDTYLLQSLITYQYSLSH